MICIGDPQVSPVLSRSIKVAPITLFVKSCTMQLVMGVWSFRGYNRVPYALG
jgi:hypothetical protein